MLRRTRILGMGLAVCFALAAVSPKIVLAETNAFRLYDDTDAPGYDLGYYGPPTLDSCQKQCLEERQCKAFTYNGLNESCFLKDNARVQFKRHWGATTGIKIGANRLSLRRNSDAPGNDYNWFKPPTLSDCRTLCDEEPNCKAFTFNKSKQVCFLKNKRDISLIRFDGAITGVKVTRTSEPWPSERVNPSSQPPATSSANGFSGRHEISLVREGGTFKVPVEINGVVKLHFIVDSGAADVSIPEDVVRTLLRSGTIQESDFLGVQQYRLADGTTVESVTFRIKHLRVGSRVLEGVTGSIADVDAPLLLGQSFLNRFKSWSIDNQKQVLILE